MFGRKKKKRTFAYTAVVDRAVSDTIDITIEANTEDEALIIARKVLSVFPEAHEEEGVVSCLVTDRQYQNSELMHIQDQEDEGARA